VGSLHVAEKTLKVGMYLDINSTAGGMFQYARVLMGVLAKNGAQVVLVTRSTEVFHELGEVQSADECIFIPRNRLETIITWLGVFMNAGNMIKKIAKNSLNTVKRLNDVDVDFWVFPAQDIQCILVDMPAVTAIHDLMHKFYPQFPEVGRFGRRWIRDKRYQAISNHSSMVLVDSEIGATHVEETYNINKKNIIIVPFTAPDYIRETSGERPEGMEPKEKYLLYPAQFWMHKNHEMLVEAVSKVAKEYPDFLVVFSGHKTHCYSKLYELVESLDLHAHVRFLGQVGDENIRWLYRNAEGLIFPSFFGPTNIPPLEALACNLPMALSDLFGAREQMKNSALYFNPLLVDEIIMACSSLWSEEDVRSSLFREMRLHPISEFDQRTSDSIVGLLNRLRSRNNNSVCR
jgi:glycosyltransferase involved in cell wall biosynthesis